MTELHFIPKILYVDDDMDFLELFRVSFSEKLDITTSISCVEALNLLKSGEFFDAVVSDYDMPEMNGLELLKKIKAINPFTPVVLYTGQGNEAVAREAFVSGAADYFTKDLLGFAHKEKLVHVIKQVCTSRKFIEESEENNRLISQYSVVPMAVIQNEMIVFANEAFCSLFNLAYHEKLRVHYNAICSKVFEQDRENLLQLFSRMEESGETFEKTTEYRIESKDGRLIWLHQHVKPVVYRKKSGYLLTVSDATLKKEAESFCCDQQMIIRELLENDDEMSLVLDSAFNIISASDGFLTCFGFAREQIFRKNYFELFPDTSPQVKTIFKETINGGEPFVYPVSMTMPDGSPARYQMKTKSWKNRNGSIGGIIIRLEILNEGRQPADILKSKIELSKFFEDSTDLLAVIDRQGNFINLNRYFELESGYSRKEMIGMNVFTSGIVSSDTLPILAENLEKLEKFGHCPTFEITGVRKDQGKVFYEVRAFPLKINDETIAYQATLRNVTDRNRLREELIAKNSQLKDFAFKVSHDLKNPVNKIRGFLMAINDNRSLFDRFFERIINITTEMLSFINDLLDQSLSGTSTKHKSEVNIRELLEGICRDLNFCSENLIKLEFDLASPSVCGDPLGLKQVFVNLLDNAVKFRDPRKENLIINISSHREKNGCRIVFRDNGSGFEESVKNSLKEAGFTLDPKRGSGFGLHIAGKIVESHGGSIDISSEGPGTGAEVTIFLPISDQ